MQSDNGKQIRRRKARPSEDKTQVLISDNKELTTETGRQIERRAAALMVSRFATARLAVVSKIQVSSTESTAYSDICEHFEQRMTQ